ncbi:MAG: hypothetical protein AAF192_08345, partial [Pseudomonadota bacterium]
MTTRIAAAAAAFVLAAAPAFALPVERLVFKVADSTPAPTSAGFIDAWQGWINPGGFNEGAAQATSLTNNGFDYKDSWVDSNWGVVDQVRVSMYSGGVEQRFMLFNPGATPADFFDRANYAGGSYQLANLPVEGSGVGAFFSTAGDSGIDRHWFINDTYGGCPRDFGFWAVLDQRPLNNYICNWENAGATALGENVRGLLYATGTTATDWDNRGNGIGVADVFAISVTYDD